MDKQFTSITPPSGFSLGLKELWQYRELFYFFTWRDIKVKYKQTLLGITWALLQPLAMMLIFTFIFSRTLHLDNTAGIPYPLFVLSALLVWNLFYGAVSHAGESMIQHANIIRKIYFPRLIIPASSVLVSLFDFFMALIILIAAIIYYQHFHWTAIIYFPAGIILTLVAAFGLGSLFSAMNVKFRDFRYALPFMLQLLFFASQVIYPLSAIKDQTLKFLLALNPVNGAIELIRAPFYQTAPDSTIVGLGMLTALLLTFIGLTYFRKTEAFFADIA